MTDRTSPAFRAAEAIYEALRGTCDLNEAEYYSENYRETMVALIASVIDTHLPGYLRGTTFHPPRISQSVVDAWAREQAKGDNRLYHFLLERAKALT